MAVSFEGMHLFQVGKDKAARPVGFFRGQSGEGKSLEFGLYVFDSKLPGYDKLVDRIATASAGGKGYFSGEKPVVRIGSDPGSAGYYDSADTVRTLTNSSDETPATLVILPGTDDTSFSVNLSINIPKQDSKVVRCDFAGKVPKNDLLIGGSVIHVLLNTEQIQKFLASLVVYK